MKATEITIKASVAAERESTWKRYTEPEHITKWNFASDDWHCPSASNDLRAGGVYTARMEAKDGSFGFDFGATYDEVIPNEKLAYTIGDGRKVTVQFTEDGNETVVTITFEAENQNSVELQRNGWQAILNNFKKYTESNM